MRKQIVAANWKMNLTPDQGLVLVKDIIKEKIDLKYHQGMVICPPFTHLSLLAKTIEDSASKIQLGAQNISEKASGAFTGEISGEMLKSLNTRFVIVGHSERRTIYNEDNETIRKKIDAVLSSKMIPIFCCGESIEVRKANKHFEHIQKQLEDSIFHLNSETASSHLVIAYEPIWAIGTGNTASVQQAEEIHQFIRELLAEKWGSDVADEISILYGGSVKKDNALELFSSPNVDGGLIGGASLEADSFIAIAKSLN